MKSFIDFIEIHDTGKKTKSFYIQNKANFAILGYIIFFPQWRKFVFRPNNEESVIFDPSCLREIISFCEEQTAQWRAGQSAKDETTTKGE